MAKITLVYPDTGLSPSISVVNRITGIEDFSGTMTEVSTTATYIYDFTESTTTDYIYTSTVVDYEDISGVIYQDDVRLEYLDAPISSVQLNQNIFGTKEFKREDDKKLKKLLDDRLKETEEVILEGVDSQGIKSLIKEESSSIEESITTRAGEVEKDIRETRKDIREDVVDLGEKTEKQIGSISLEKEFIELNANLDILKADLESRVVAVQHTTNTLSTDLSAKVNKSDLNKINNLLIDIKTKK